MRIYTRTGDTGQTGLLGGARVDKDDLRIEAVGAIDELNAALGVCRAVDPGFSLDEILQEIQHRLFDLGAEIAAPPGSGWESASVGPRDTARLEESIDAQTEALEPLSEFILPGGTLLAAQLHLARTICRRAERVLVALSHREELRIETLGYLNRLSDWLFVAARTANNEAGHPDVKWRKRSSTDDAR